MAGHASTVGSLARTRKPQSGPEISAQGTTLQNVTPHPALEFLAVLGLEPGEAVFRTVRQGQASEAVGFDAAALEAGNQAGNGVYVALGDNTRHLLVVELSGGQPHRQLQAPELHGLPAAVATIASGDSLYHCWAITESLPVDQWRSLQRRIVQHFDSEPCEAIPVPGFERINPVTGKGTGERVELLCCNGWNWCWDWQRDDNRRLRYSLEEIERCLPLPLELPAGTPDTSAPPPPHRDEDEGASRTERELAAGIAAGTMKRCPVCSRVSPSSDAHCWGCGHDYTNPGGGRDWEKSELEAFHRLALLTATFTGEPWTLKPGELYSPSKAKQGDYSSRVRLIAAAHDLGEEQPKGKQQLTFEQRWRLLEGHAAKVSGEAWPLMKATASLAATANELDIHRLTSRQLEQLLEAAQRRQRPTAAPVDGGGVFTIQATPWAVDGVFRHGLNLLVGQAGAGKSRLAAACIGAWLQGEQDWLSRAMPCELPVQQRHALIVGTDQPLEDWAITLEPVGLVQRLGPSKVQLHSRVTLHPLEAGTLLDTDGLATIRRWCDDHPGGAVLIDSLAAVLPPGVDEDKSAVGKPIQALQEALGSCWGILTHHTRKGAGREGNLGVGAGRGSSAIDGAVSRVIGLGLIHKMEGGVMVPQEADPRRELLSTKRGGATLHIVISSDGSGQWRNEGTAEELKREERRERTLASLTDNQTAVMEVLEGQGDWLNCRQIVEAKGEAYDNKGGRAATTRKTLKRLAGMGLLQAKRQGTEWLYRVMESRESQSLADEIKETGSTGSLTAPQGISPALPVALPGSTGSPAPAGPDGGEPQGEQGRADGEPVGEPPKPTAPQWESQESRSDSHAALGSGSPALAVTVEGEPGWQLPGGRIPRSGNVVAVDPNGESHHVAASGVKLDLSRLARQVAA